MPTIEVTRLPVEDWQSYKNIRLEALLRAPEAFSTRYAEMVDQPDAFWQGRLREAAENVNRWLLFARVEGQVVGMMGAWLDETGEAVEITSVYVTPRQRGQGVAQALMEAILAAARSTATVSVARLAVSDAAPRAQAFYRRMGFRVVDSHEDTLGDGVRHIEWIMEKRLGGEEGGEA